MQFVAELATQCLTIKHQVYKVIHSDVKKFQKTGLPMVQSQTNKINFFVKEK